MYLCTLKKLHSLKLFSFCASYRPPKTCFFLCVLYDQLRYNPDKKSSCESSMESSIEAFPAIGSAPPPTPPYPSLCFEAFYAKRKADQLTSSCLGHSLHQLLHENQARVCAPSPHKKKRSFYSLTTEVFEGKWEVSQRLLRFCLGLLSEYWQCSSCLFS